MSKPFLPGVSLFFLSAILCIFILAGCMPNMDNDIVNIVVNTPPTTPTLTGTTNGMEVGFLYTLTGTSSNITNVFVNTDNGTYLSIPVANNHWSLVISNIGLGVHTNNYFSKNSSGESSYTNFVWVTRAAIPYVQIVSVSNGAVLHYPGTNVSGTALVDSPFVITNVRFRINNGAYSNASGTSNWSTGALNIGTNTVTVVACASNGRTSDPVTVNFYSDPTIASTNGDSYTPGSGWTLAWSDEFNSGAVDTDIWNKEVRNDGCGNNEKEYYTARLNNVWTSGGTLIIKAIKESYLGNNYTSGRLTTQSNKTWQYGKFSARIMLPTGKGMWPAFWLLGDDIVTTGWPGCGELDIMENKGAQPTISSGAIHFGPPWPNNKYFSATYTLPSGNLYSTFHVFEIIWTSSNVNWYVDGALFQTVTKTQLTNTGQPWVFDHPFFYILNLAIGGNFDGDPDGTTVFPQYMFVDWIRVYTN